MSMISSGWRETGRVLVVGHPYFAYQELWRTGGQTLALLALVTELTRGYRVHYPLMMLGVIAFEGVCSSTEALLDTPAGPPIASTTRRLPAGAGAIPPEDAR